MWSFLAEIKPHFILGLKKKPRPPYENHDFDELCLDLAKVGAYCLSPGDSKLTSNALSLQ